MSENRVQISSETAVDASDPLTRVDVVLGLLTLPLLLWVIMVATSTSAQALASRSARIRVYVSLLIGEIIIAAVLVTWWLT